MGTFPPVRPHHIPRRAASTGHSGRGASTQNFDGHVLTRCDLGSTSRSPAAHAWIPPDAPIGCGHRNLDLTPNLDSRVDCDRTPDLEPWSVARQRGSLANKTAAART